MSSCMPSARLWLYLPLPPFGPLLPRPLAPRPPLTCLLCAPPPLPAPLCCRQRAKSKMVLEHLVVAKAGKTDRLAQAELDDILRYGAKELFADDEEEPAAAVAAAGGEAAAAGADAGAAAAAGGDGGDEQAATAAAAAVSKPRGALRIVWDDAALARLLDRSQVEAAAAAAAGEEEQADDDEFTKAFKVGSGADKAQHGLTVAAPYGLVFWGVGVELPQACNVAFWEPQLLAVS